MAPTCREREAVRFVGEGWRSSSAALHTQSTGAMKDVNQDLMCRWTAVSDKVERTLQVIVEAVSRHARCRLGGIQRCLTGLKILPKM